MKLPDGVRVTGMRVSPDGTALNIDLRVGRPPTRCIWVEGPGPYPKAIRNDIVTLCGTVIRDQGRWQVPTMRSITTAELLLHHAQDESAKLCRNCLRELAIHPIRCSAGDRCTGDLLCKG